jgi:glutamyl-tRNA synthetase
LIDEGKAYVSKEEPTDAGKRSEVIRFKNPNLPLMFHDAVLGDITFNTAELGDFVIARELDSPLYHFTVVVDDHEMGVTHIIRGQEHVSNTPRQILIQEAIGAIRPIYAHASIILNEERAKLSKRDPTVRPALEYRDEGYLPGAILNFMALLGWNPGTEKELFSKYELVNAFSFERMQKQGAIFNPEKLEWLNKEHIKQLAQDDRFEWIKRSLPEEFIARPSYSDERLRKILDIIIDRIGHFGEIKQIVLDGELDYYFERPEHLDPTILVWKNLRQNSDGAVKTASYLHEVNKLLKEHNGNWDRATLKDVLWSYAEKVGRGDVLWPTRFALSGKEKSPDPFQLLEILGKEESIDRIQIAYDALSHC